MLRYPPASGASTSKEEEGVLKKTPHTHTTRSSALFRSSTKARRRYTLFPFSHFLIFTYI
jgi:hypothetical protein